MVTRALDDAVEWFDSRAAMLWVLAVASFGVADALTTAVGYPRVGIVEAGPVVAPLLRDYGLGAVAVSKVAVLGIAYLAWCTVPRPQAVGVPLALATVGVLASVWNTAVIAATL